MRNNSDSVFRDAPIPKAVAQMAVPTMLSMLVVVLYNMVDTFFVGQTGDANQVAAVSVATPVFLILMAFGNMFGIGGSSLLSRLLGAGEGDRAKKVKMCIRDRVWSARSWAVSRSTISACSMRTTCGSWNSSKNFVRNHAFERKAAPRQCADASQAAKSSD